MKEYLKPDAVIIKFVSEETTGIINGSGGSESNDFDEDDFDM